MKLAVQIFSWISIVIGALAILGGVVTGTGELDGYALLGGGLFLTQGLLAIIYIYTNENNASR